eukprot:TRINITY_DN9061_c0_g1_i1.p1 TRINITY_DN9061_c0_g1~~TRINITY_DN9061_c0_g1_i1.p1  ORF type:complete len:106 (+),score=11.80 TRINITY_DN9061_c0_g1_i1:64-381(+)
MCIRDRLCSLSRIKLVDFQCVLIRQSVHKSLPLALKFIIFSKRQSNKEQDSFTKDQKLSSKTISTRLFPRHINYIPHVLCVDTTCLLYTSPSPRDGLLSRMPSSA